MPGRHSNKSSPAASLSFTATSLAEDVAFNEVAILNATSLTGDVAKKESIYEQYMKGTIESDVTTLTKLICELITTDK